MARRLTVALMALVLGLAVVPAADAGGSVRFQGAVNQGHAVRPSTLWLSADGSLVVLHMRWSGWGGSVAAGSGDADYHGCSPNCAQAPVHHAAVTVHLWQVLTCGGQRYYNNVTLYRRNGSVLRYSRHWAPCAARNGTRG
jgi:hypothetical protein